MTLVRDALDAQLGAPAGRPGRLVLRILNLANRSLNHATVDVLALASGDRVLDVGFGGGVGVRRVLRTGASVTAIDPSPAAVRAGQRAFGSRVVVRRGDAVRAGESAGAMDAVLSVNTIYFWPDVDAGLRSLHEVLRVGGQLALGIEDRELARHARDRPGLPPTTPDLMRALEAAGFTSVEVASHRGGRTVILANRP